MEQIALAENHSFTIEPHGKRVRLVVYKHNVEKVCRKESIKKLVAFIQGNENELFNGRLRLIKDADGVQIAVKGAILGKFGKDLLLEWVDGVKLGKEAR